MEGSVHLERFIPRVRTGLLPSVRLLIRDRSGVFVVHYSTSTEGTYTDQSYINDMALGARIRNLKTPADIRSIFPPGAKTASFDGVHGYINLDGGWANAAHGVELLMKKVAELGVTILPGKPVVDLVKGDGGQRTVGVKCTDGTQYAADVVVIAAGSWTPSSFPKLDLMGKCLATG